MMAEELGDSVDLLITDVIMPEMNGRELAAKIHEKLGEVPVIYMSGYTDSVISYHGLFDEGRHLLRKPFTAAELLDAVRLELDKSNKISFRRQ